jgi:hypothetical protein
MDMAKKLVSAKKERPIYDFNAKNTFQQQIQFVYL